MLEHYFVSAWLPAGNGPREFYTKQLGTNEFSAGVVLPVASIAPGQIGRISTALYAGPAQTKLDKIAPGLGLTVDYGWLTIFSTPLFWLMSHINDLVNNWGVSIILLTVLIKLVFLPACLQRVTVPWPKCAWLLQNWRKSNSNTAMIAKN